MLIVSEELKELTLLLDKYRSEHAIQLKTLTERRQRQQRKQETKLKTLKQDQVNADSSLPFEGMSFQETFASRSEIAEETESDLQQEMLQHENQALFEELTSLSSRVHETEKMMIEIATLNQMLSSQIMNQSEQIEQVYTDAIQASLNMTRGNVHLKKAVNLNKSTMKYVAVILILASLTLLFFDRFYS